MSILKNQEDLKNLKYSCLVVASALHHLAKMVKPGISAAELNDFAVNFVRSYDCEPSFLGYQGYKYGLCVSINNEVVHGICPENKIIPNDSIVSLDYGTIFKGMYSDSAITVIVGEVDEKEQRLVATCKESLWQGIKKLKAGATLGEVGGSIDQYILKEGFGNVKDLGGHGAGYAVHAEPWIGHFASFKGGHKKFFENQIICLEPMITLSGNGKVAFDEKPSDGWTVYTKDGSRAAHFEHQMIITKSGCEVLTDIPEDQILPIK